jgi:hypothetical protein
MKPKTQQNIYAIIFAFLVFLTLFFSFKMIWGAAIGPAFLAFLIWNNQLRKNSDNPQDKTE